VSVSIVTTDGSTLAATAGQSGCEAAPASRLAMRVCRPAMLCRCEAICSCIEDSALAV